MYVVDTFGGVGLVEAGREGGGLIRHSAHRTVRTLSALGASTALAAAVLVAGASPAAANGCAESFSGGSGGLSTPFLISTAADLNALQGDSRCWGYIYRQTEDLPMGGAAWSNGVGTSLNPFSGYYDGGGYVISGLTIVSSTASEAVGLFGRIGYPGVVANVTFTGSVTGADSSQVGGLAGYSEGTVSNCSTTGDVTAGDNAYVGGLVGFQAYETISDSFATGDVTGGDLTRVGGAVGLATRPVTGTYATGAVSGGVNATVGGLVGNINGTGSVTDSYATGPVSGDNASYVGGLAGWNDFAGGTISNSYATGAVTGAGSASVGGLVGSQSGTVSNSFWNTETSGTATGAGFGSDAGMTGKTTAEMKALSTFADAGWSIAQAATSTTTWGICAGVDYPYLVWQYSSDPCSGASPSAQSSETFTFTFNTSTGGRCFTWSVTAGPVTLPDGRAACTPEGTALVGWTVPGQANAFSDGGTVVASGDQTFTAVARHPRVRVTYDANVGHDTPCLIVGIDTAERAVTVEVPRDGVLADRPTCTPAGVQFVGWTDRPTTDGPGVAVPGAGVFAGGSVVPGKWSVDPDVVNVIRLYAMWRQAEPIALRAHTATPSSHSAAVSTATAKPGQFCKKADRGTSVTTKSYGKLTCRADRKNDRYSRWYRR